MVTAHVVTEKGVLWPQNHSCVGSQPKRGVCNGDDQEMQVTEATWLFGHVEGRRHRAAPGTHAGGGIKESAEGHMEDGAIPNKQNSQCPWF